MGFVAVWNKFYKTLASIRTGIILLIVVGIVSAVGTVVLQRPTTEIEDIQRAYSPATLMWLDRLGLTDVFHAWWFVVLLTLVSLSIIFASLERWPTAWKFYARPSRRLEPHVRAALPNHAEIKISDAKLGLDTAERALRKLGLKPERIAENGEVSLYSERHRISVLAVYIVHFSLLLIFTGGIVDAIFGYRGSLMLNEGDSTNVISIRQNGVEGRKRLPFSIRCDSAGQENYADGSPKKWWSNLAIVEGGRDVRSKQIVVNDPLTYKGIRFYQSSFGKSDKVAKLQLQASPVGNGAPKTISIGMNETVQLDGGNSVSLKRFIPDYYIQDNEVHQRSNNLENPAVELVLADQSGTHDLWLFPRVSNITQDPKAAYTFTLTDLKMAFFTGLEVSHEPGQWSVWGGVLLMAFGLGVAFYMVHMRFWVTTAFDARQGLVLWVGGACNKNKERFEQRFEEVVEAIRSELKLDGAKAEKKQDEPAKDGTLARV